MATEMVCDFCGRPMTGRTPRMAKNKSSDPVVRPAGGIVHRGLGTWTDRTRDAYLVAQVQVVIDCSKDPAACCTVCLRALLANADWQQQPEPDGKPDPAPARRGEYVPISVLRELAEAAGHGAVIPTAAAVQLRAALEDSTEGKGWGEGNGWTDSTPVTLQIPAGTAFALLQAIDLTGHSKPAPDYYLAAPSPGVVAIAAERVKQVVHGHTAGRDAGEYHAGDLAGAAMLLLKNVLHSEGQAYPTLAATDLLESINTQQHGTEHVYEIAGALLAAEIDRQRWLDERNPEVEGSFTVAHDPPGAVWCSIKDAAGNTCTLLEGHAEPHAFTPRDPDAAELDPPAPAPIVKCGHQWNGKRCIREAGHTGDHDCPPLKEIPF